MLAVDDILFLNLWNLFENVSLSRRIMVHERIDEEDADQLLTSVKACALAL